MDRSEVNPSAPHRLALVEVLDRDGQVLRAVDVLDWPISLGRDLGNHIVLDDPHVAPWHARLERAEDGTVLLKVGDTRNGVRLGTRPLAAGSQTALDGAQNTFQMGLTHIRLRVPEVALAPEQPLPLAESGLSRLALMMVMLVALSAAEQWVSTEPGGEWTKWLPLLLGMPFAVVGWSLMWALASKLFRHGFDFKGHLAIVLKILLPLQVADMLLPQVAASLDWPWLWQSVHWLTTLALALLAWQHGRRVLPQHARAVGLTVTGLALLGIGVEAVNLHQRTEGLKHRPYMSTLPLPAMRWHALQPSNQLMDEARQLEAPLKAKVQAAQSEDDSADEDDAAEE